jgi:hypothetical protein
VALRCIEAVQLLWHHPGVGFQEDIPISLQLVQMLLAAAQGRKFTLCGLAGPLEFF